MSLLLVTSFGQSLQTNLRIPLDGTITRTLRGAREKRRSKDRRFRVGATYFAGPLPAKYRQQR